MIFPMGVMNPNNAANLGCDTEADIPDLADFSKNLHLSEGSTCLCFQTGELYGLGSNGWVKVGGGV